LPAVEYAAGEKEAAVAARRRTMQCIAFDSHKHYTWALVQDEKGKVLREQRIDHARGALRGFLEEFEPGSPVAVETIGNWYWITDEIEAAGMVPQLVNARRAKLMSGSINKTDRLDARGLNRLQRSGTLPTVWIPPRELRDARELPRTRMVLVRQRTRLKNRIHANLAKYGLKASGVSDLFGVRGRRILDDLLNEFPTETRYATEALIEELDHLQAKIKELEGRTAELFGGIEALHLIQTLPGWPSSSGWSFSPKLVMSTDSPVRATWLRMPGRLQECMPAEDTFGTGRHALTSITI
jgi:transposase